MSEPIPEGHVSANGYHFYVGSLRCFCPGDSMTLGISGDAQLGKWYRKPQRFTRLRRMLRRILRLK